MESEDSGSRGPEGSIEDTSTHLPMDVLGSVSGTREVSSNSNIAQMDAESKGNSEPVKKSVRFQLSDRSAGDVGAILQQPLLS